MSKTVRIVVIVSVIALLAWPLLVIGNWLTAKVVYEHFVDILSTNLGWNKYLIKALVLASLVPFFYAVKLLFSPLSRERRRLGAILMTAMAVIYNLFFYFATKDVNFEFGTGKALKYYCWEEKGLSKFDRPGFCPSTNKPLKEMTPEVDLEWDQMRDKPLLKVDPTELVWFSDITGSPRLYYYRFSDGQLEFFNRPGRHPQTGDPLIPVTKELFFSWRADNQARVGKAAGSSIAVAGNRGAGGNGMRHETQADARTANFRGALIPGAGHGAVGLLTLGVDELGQEGADALVRHLPGFNGNALRAGLLRRERLGAELYAGDADLLNETMATTGLGSLVVAQVTVQCAKRSQLDSDLLSCDLVVSARKFGAHGTPAGSASARGTGAGFSTADAMEQAAERAAGGLSGLAAR